MVEERGQFPHQFSGTKSSIPSISCSRFISQGAPHLFRHRQLHNHVSYKQARGHSVSNTVKSSNRIMELCPELNLIILAIHIPGKLNVLADHKSRIFKDSIDWMLNPSIFKGIVASPGRPDTDLFASRVNHQIPEFVSWRAKLNAVATNAFNLTWNYHLSYLFPPFSLIPLCLK